MEGRGAAAGAARLVVCGLAAGGSACIATHAQPTPLTPSTPLPPYQGMMGGKPTKSKDLGSSNLYSVLTILAALMLLPFGAAIEGPRVCHTRWLASLLLGAGL